MIKDSLFAAEEREAKLARLGDVLQVMERHVDFAVLAAEIDRAAPRPLSAQGGHPPFPTLVMVKPRRSRYVVAGLGGPKSRRKR